jgi:hypothetical protein
LTEITQRAVVQATVDDLFAQADELFAILLQGDHDEENLSLTIQRTSPGPLELGAAFRVTARTGGLSLGADLCCTEYVPPRHVTLQSTNGLPLKAMLAFQPHQDNNTIMTVQLCYEPPAGLVGMMFETLAPQAKIEQEMKRGLQRLQQHLEAAGREKP